MSGVAMVVAREQGQRQEWTGLLEAKGLRVVAQRGPGEAMWRLEQEPVCLVLTEWRGQPDRAGATTGKLLRELAARYPHVHVIVCGEGLSAAVQQQVVIAHPLAFVHDAGTGAAMLGRRVEALAGRRVADLLLRAGVVFHEPSGAVFRHPLAVGLVLGYPHCAGGEESRGRTAMAAMRFRRWLEECGSAVSVEALRGEGRYRLVVERERRESAA